MRTSLPAAYDRTELRQLRLFFEDLKEQYRIHVRNGDFEPARELLQQRLHLLREVLREHELHERLPKTTGVEP